MSSTGANRESEGGTMKNVIDAQATKPQSHTYAQDQSRSNMGQENQTTASASTTANHESQGGTMKNVIDNPATKPQSYTNAGDQSQSNMGQGNNRCSGGGPDHRQGESSCNSCQKK